ncbi:phospholipid phosphatase, partial [Phocaeicola vulgatus]
IEGCFIGYLIYLLYKFIQKKIFYKPRCISNQYTASGYLISDINLFYIILISTYFFIIIAGMIVTHTLNL